MEHMCTKDVKMLILIKKTTSDEVRLKNNQTQRNFQGSNE